VTRQLIEEGRNHLLLGGMIETGCPVRILQGVEDPDVPWRHAVELVSRLASDDVVLTLVKDGDHRLSRPEDIERLIRASGAQIRVRVRSLRSSSSLLSSIMTWPAQHSPARFERRASGVTGQTLQIVERQDAQKVNGAEPSAPSTNSWRLCDSARYLAGPSTLRVPAPNANT
jgi:hypothetical protein